MIEIRNRVKIHNAGLYLNFIDKVKKKASSQLRTIVLPESHDERVIEAALLIAWEGFAKIVLLEDSDKEIEKKSRA